MRKGYGTVTTATTPKKTTKKAPKTAKPNEAPAEVLTGLPVPASVEAPEKEKAPKVSTKEARRREYEEMERIEEEIDAFENALVGGKPLTPKELKVLFIIRGSSEPIPTARIGKVLSFLSGGEVSDNYTALAVVIKSFKSRGLIHTEMRPTENRPRGYHSLSENGERVIELALEYAELTRASEAASSKEEEDEESE